MQVTAVKGCGEGRIRGRILLIAGAATVAGLLAVGLVVYPLVPGALSVEYERYEGDRIAWNGPQSELRAYERVIHETLESFAPQM